MLREAKRRQTRLDLIIAALRLVDASGADRVTVDEIAAAAGVSQRTFFNYFATKEDALVGDPLEGCTDLRAQLLAARADQSLLDALLDALAPVFQQIDDDRDLWLLRMRVIQHNPQLLPLLIAAAATAEQQFAEAVAERGSLPPNHPFPAVVAAATNGAVRVALIRWAAGDDPRPLEHHVREAFGMLAAGLVLPPIPRNA
ncbi:AcrR family transcriptional regulator [Actinoplanes lutulentus]|uniref:TetR family transcriptional regulator n=1 Tax=Actinoplanes lutulentus TaxID=1287878 RepID=A0A327Z6I0_9ACTN|nr:TetR/AcrR family transcriptional regulator [Actinoplanes lutulentus]MBB2946246.1 AcrR family transcriptional regulator [Actinoplanes lutulentus]RAK32934.1 TetR family transcriptional regulator [Actinoplanes lutulentus]